MTENRLEPDCLGTLEGFARSQAISAKRTADALERLADMFEGIPAPGGQLSLVEQIGFLVGAVRSHQP